MVEAMSSLLSRGQNGSRPPGLNLVLENLSDGRFSGADLHLLQHGAPHQRITNLVSDPGLVI